MVRDTQFGFQWGPGMVTRQCDDERWGTMICVHGKREAVEIRVTPGGSLRVEKIRKTHPHEKERIEKPETHS